MPEVARRYRKGPARPQLCRTVIWAILPALMGAVVLAEKPALPEKVGSVRLTGLSDFDCDSLANDAPNQWRWLSLPESRLVLNPTASDDFAPLPLRPDLPLHAACYAGRKPQRLTDLVTVGIGSRDGGTADWYRHTWFPHKLAFHATYQGGGHRISGCDFLADENTVVRILDVLPGRSSSVLSLQGAIHGHVQPDSRALLVKHEDFFHALVVGKAAGLELTPVRLDVGPQVSGGKWHLETAFGAIHQAPGDPPPESNEVSHYFVAIGFATRAEGAGTAVRRASEVFFGLVSKVGDYRLALLCAGVLFLPAAVLTYSLLDKPREITEATA